MYKAKDQLPSLCSPSFWVPFFSSDQYPAGQNIQIAPTGFLINFLTYPHTSNYSS